MVVYHTETGICALFYVRITIIVAESLLNLQAEQLLQ